MDEESEMRATPSILFVDDERRIGVLFERLVGGRAGVQTASSGREALELIEEHDYDAVVCDLYMPEMSGQELYRKVKQKRPELARRFLFVTGGLQSEACREFVESVDNEVVYKPFELLVLESALASVLGRDFEL